MEIVGRAKKVSIYIDESDKWSRKPLYLAILEMLKAENCAGATVSRALAGFGAHSRIHTSRILRLSEDLPILVEIVDAEDRIQAFLPVLDGMVQEGLVTVATATVIFYRAGDPPAEP